MQRTVFVGLVAAVTTLAASWTGAAPPTILTAEGDTPAILDSLDLAQPFASLAIAGDGRVAVARVDTASKEARSVVEIAGPDAGTMSLVELPGQLRALLFSADSRYLIALLDRRTRRHDEATVLRIDLADGKLRRISERVPRSATDIGLWSGRNSLMIACRDEIRTLLLPDFRSGPLYRTIGDNLSIASVGGSVVLIGRPDGIVRMDLADRPGPDEMPIRGRSVTPGPVVDIVYAPRVRRGLAELADGRIFEIGADLTLRTELGTGRLLHGHRIGSGEPTAPDDWKEPHPPEPTFKDEPSPTAAPGGQPRGRLQPTPAPPSIDDEPTPKPAPLPQQPSGRPDEPAEVVVTRPEPIDKATTGVAAQITGRIDGPAAERVVAVVLHGPNSVLREAARVQPSADGTWSVGGLSPGRYRIQLDGGGDTALATDPPLRLVDLATEGPASVADFRVLRAF